MQVLFVCLQEHTDVSLKGLETIVREARIEQVRMSYAELAATMADVATKLNERIEKV